MIASLYKVSALLLLGGGGREIIPFPLYEVPVEVSVDEEDVNVTR